MKIRMSKQSYIKSDRTPSEFQRPSAGVVEINGLNVYGVWGEHQYITSEMTEDVSCPSICDELIKNIDAVISGKIIEGSWAGNAWYANLTKEGVFFENQHNEAEVGGRVSLHTYRAALTAWKQFLLNTACIERDVELPDD